MGICITVASESVSSSARKDGQVHPITLGKRNCLLRAEASAKSKRHSSKELLKSPFSRKDPYTVPRQICTDHSTPRCAFYRDFVPERGK